MSKKTVIANNSPNRPFIKAGEIIFQTDSNGIIISASEQLSVFTALTTKDIIGSTLINIIDKKDHLKLASFLKKEKAAGKETIALSVKGEKRNRAFQFSVQYIPDAQDPSFLLDWNIDSKDTLNSVPEKNDLLTVSQMFHTNPQSVIIYNASDNQIIYANAVACKFYGYNENEFAQLFLNDLLGWSKSDFDSPFLSGTHFFTRKNDKPVLQNVFVSSILINGKTFQIVFTNSFFETTQIKHQEQWLSLERDVLEMNARPSATLKNTVDFYLKGIEKMFPGMICSILMLRDDKESIQHLSSPGLPVEFSESINGAKIGRKAGSCGTAMYLQQVVITKDINTDPLWEDYKALAAQYGLQSCWSFPITNSQNEVLATIAAYYRYPKLPTDKELHIMEVACNLLRIIFENKQAEANLRQSNERYLLATKATHDAIYDWDIIKNTVYRGESFYSLFGYSKNQAERLFPFLEEKLHPDDKNRVIESLKCFIEKKSPDIWENEYRFLNAFGKYIVVCDRGFLIFNHEGNITRLVGSMMDVTERKELEKRLLKQEVDKQKLVAQTVVNAQEKERAEIGKELHENVNQILSSARLYLELAKTDEKERMNLIKRSSDNIYDAINEIGNISRSLVPPSIGDLGLIESIEDLVEHIRVTKKLYTEFCYEGDIDELLGQKQKLMLFRIIQEQVNNVLKHANARNIFIELMIDGHMINLAVSDDGKGFDFEEVKNNKGAGLQNIVSRTELFDGKINIVTAPNKGCKLNIHVPISKF